MKKLLLSTMLLLCFIPTALQAKGWKAKDVENMIIRVNDNWQKTHPEHGRAFWDNAVYHTGNMEAVMLFGNAQWLNYSLGWADQNLWMGATEQNTEKWKYLQYGEDQQHVLFGDWQICFQTYLDLNELLPDEHNVARAKQVMGYIADSQQNDYWWWADALYMVMPVMTKMYKLTGDRKYLDKMYQNWQYANSIMYDKSTGLYFRDGKYVYPSHKTAHGKKDFWARGDGWVMAAFAKVLKDLPEDDPHRKEYLKYYQKMAKTIVEHQQKEGYWTRSIFDPSQAPGRETSGTALFTYGLLWGINNGLLDEKYLPAALKGWHYLSTIALQKDGTIGYVQPIGEKAIPGQVVDAKSVTNFGTGAFLLAACEYYRYLLNKENKVAVHGAFYKIRKDDLAWENENCCYRFYGPALQRSGEKSYGTDVWVKNTSKVVMPKWYQRDFEGNIKEDSLRKAGNKQAAREVDQSTSFHIDHGEGMDCYAVGPTLGLGAPALMVEGRLIYPYCFKEYKILENGPEKFEAELVYNPVMINGEQVVEHRLLSLEKGDFLNKMTVWYEGMTKTCDFATGIVLHDANPPKMTSKYIVYEDPTENPKGNNGKIFTALKFDEKPDETKVFEQEGARHALALYHNYKGEPITYYFGAMWSKYKIHSLQEWISKIL